MSRYHLVLMNSVTIHLPVFAPKYLESRNQTDHSAKPYLVLSIAFSIFQQLEQEFCTLFWPTTLSGTKLLGLKDVKLGT